MNKIGLLHPACKCCGGPTGFFAKHDLSRTCEDHAGPVFAPSGIDVPYYRCSVCGFVFTSHFDTWSKRELAERIYNADYILADPDFAAARPEYLADALAKMLGPIRSAISLLDFGGGQGKLVAELDRQGFGNCQFFDPFFGAGNRPDGSFDLVTAFEVAEHAIDPLGAFRDALSHVTPTGALLFSTSLQDRRPDPDWWYIAPRNGHVSIHSHASLQQAAAVLGVKYLSLNDHLHVFFRTPHSLLVHQIAEGQRNAALYAASRQGLLPLVGMANLFGQLGFAVQPRDLKHMIRATLVSSGLS